VTLRDQLIAEADKLAPFGFARRVVALMRAAAEYVPPVPAIELPEPKAKAQTPRTFFGKATRQQGLS
jgi:hypothetical protein